MMHWMLVSTRDKKAGGNLYLFCMEIYIHMYFFTMFREISQPVVTMLVPHPLSLVAAKARLPAAGIV